MSEARGQLVIQGNPWHYRVYQFWRRHRDSAYYRENLCHYVRVVLIWAPLTWFFKMPIIKNRYSKFRWLRIWIFPFTGLAIWGIVKASLLWPKEMFEILLAFLGVLAVFGLLGGIIVSSIWLIDKIEDWQYRSQGKEAQTSFFTVARHQIVAGKQKICPFIVLPDDNASQEVPLPDWEE